MAPVSDPFRRRAGGYVIFALRFGTSSAQEAQLKEFLEHSMTRRFGLVALAIIISATVAGGMVEIFQKRTLVSKGKHEITVSHDVTDDYREAMEVIGDEYAGDVDYEKAT